MKRKSTTNILRDTRTKISGDENSKMHIPDLQAALRPVTPNFATVPTREGFDWNSIGKAIWLSESIESRKEPKYLVLFLSRRRESADVEQLVKLEKLAYEDAKKTGGLIVYYDGPITQDRNNVSFCIWRSSEKAYIASHRNPHTKAMEIARSAYERYDLERYLLRTERTDQGFRTTLIPIERNPAVPDQPSAT